MTDSQNYLSRLNSFNGFYLVLIVICIALCIGGTVIAVLLNLAVGIILATLAAALYAILSTRRAYSLLGLRFKHVRGEIHITSIDCALEDTVYVPDRFVWADVTRIGDGAFASKKNKDLLFVYIPRGIEYIGADVFGNNTSHVTVFFEGDENEWELIDKKTDFSSITTMCSAPFPRLTTKNTKKKSRSTVRDAEADT